MNKSFEFSNFNGYTMEGFLKKRGRDSSIFKKDFYKRYFILNFSNAVFHAKNGEEIPFRDIV